MATKRDFAPLRQPASDKAGESQATSRTITWPPGQHETPSAVCQTMDRRRAAGVPRVRWAVGEGRRGPSEVSRAGLGLLHPFADAERATRNVSTASFGDDACWRS